MKKTLTLKDIAENFQVSISTISKALSNSHEISEELKTRIQEYSRKNNYRPNPYAKSFRKKTNKTIAVIVPDILNSFFAQVFSGIENVANESGYNLICCFTNESHSKEKKNIEMLQDGPISGVLISIAEETEKLKSYDHLKNCIQSGLPVVMFDRVTEWVQCDKVLADDYFGAYTAVEQLIKTGCRNIGVVSLLHNLQIGKQRFRGYLDALTDYNLMADPNLIIKNFKKEEFPDQVRAMLSLNKADAILALDDYSTVNSMQIALQMGFAIPYDISLIGFSNGNLPNYVTPKLTTISQPGKQMGELAARKIISRLEGIHDNEFSFTSQHVKTSLIIRESTRVLSQEPVIQ